MLLAPDGEIIDVTAIQIPCSVHNVHSVKMKVKAKNEETAEFNSEISCCICRKFHTFFLNNYINLLR